MKLVLITAASVAAFAFGAGTASAQPSVLVPHANHYHAVPAYPPSVYGGYGYRNYSPGGFYASPGYSSFGGYSSGYGYGRGFGAPGFGHGGGYGPSYGLWGGHQQHHHQHGHR